MTFTSRKQCDLLIVFRSLHCTVIWLYFVRQEMYTLLYKGRLRFRGWGSV